MLRWKIIHDVFANVAAPFRNLHSCQQRLKRTRAPYNSFALPHHAMREFSTQKRAPEKKACTKLPRLLRKLRPNMRRTNNDQWQSNTRQTISSVRCKGQQLLTSKSFDCGVHRITSISCGTQSKCVGALAVLLIGSAAAIPARGTKLQTNFDASTKSTSAYLRSLNDDLPTNASALLTTHTEAFGVGTTQLFGDDYNRRSTRTSNR